MNLKFVRIVFVLLSSDFLHMGGLQSNYAFPFIVQYEDHLAGLNLENPLVVDDPKA